MISIPYGVSDFSALRRRNQAFVDQTRHIAALEQGPDHVLFLRPRRFGKSLWLSILEHYYDVRFADRFDELFGGLDIGRQPTALRGGFLVLRLDFSAVDTSGDDERLRSSFAARVRNRVEQFLREHEPWLSDVQPTLERLEERDDAVALLECALAAASKAGRPVYLLIDEYDNFTNELVASRHEERYKTLVHGAGLLRTFFKAIKEATSGGGVARTFTTGINPLLLSDLTSGFNIARNLGSTRELSGLLGFGLSDVRALVQQACEHLSAEQRADLGAPDGLLDLMVQWYDGYRFHPAGEPRFNPDMVLHCLESVVRGRLPDNLVDFNLRTDVGKLDLVVRKAGDFGRLFRLIEGCESIPGPVADSFGVDDLTNSLSFDSLLYYLGLLSYAEGPEPLLRVPNYVVQTLYWDEIRKLLQSNLDLTHFEPVRVALRKLMRSGAGQPFFQLVVDQVLALAVSRDLIHLSEAAVKTACLALLSMSSEIMVFSEWATHRGYADLVLVPAPTATWLSRAWMIELKYLGRGDDSPAARQRALADGRAQIERYCQDEARMAYLNQYTLKRAVALFVGVDELVWEEV